MLVLLSMAPGTTAEQFVAAGAIPPLVRLLRSGSVPMQQQRAVTLLYVLTAKGRSDTIEPIKSAGALPLLANLQAYASSEEMRCVAEELLKALTTGTSPFDDPEEGSPSALTSTAASIHHAASAAGPSSTAAAALPPAAASPQLQQQQQLQQRPRKSCWTCGTTGVPLKKCSVCAVAAYCGAGCQKADWKAHKGQCAGLKAGASGGGSSAAEEE